MNKKNHNIFDLITKLTLIIGMIGIIANIIFAIYLSSTNTPFTDYPTCYYLLGISGLVFIFSLMTRSIFKNQIHETTKK